MARILVVEDDPCIRRVIALWLKRHGHDVVAADSGTRALELIRQAPVDLLVTDVNLTGMTGLELLHNVRTESLNHHRAIVLTSRCDQTEIEERAASLGAVVHPKPFSPMHLTEAIETALTEGDGVGPIAPPASVAQEAGIDG